MDSNWQGLQGEEINKEKSVSLRQRYGKKELLTERKLSGKTGGGIELGG